MPKKFYWLKLKNDFFNQPKIKKLRRIAGGDTYTIIYLKLQLLSLTNGGRLYYEGIEDDFAEELALKIDEDTDNTRITLDYLFAQGLIESAEDSELQLVETQALIGSESDSAERVRKHREIKKNEQKALQCNEDVTDGNENVTTEIRDKRLEIENKKDSINTISSTPVEEIPYSAVKDTFNSICISLPKVQSLSDKRRAAIKAIWNAYGAEKMQIAFKDAEASDFLSGRSGQWQASFDWLMNKNNMLKVLEGNYANKTHSKAEPSGISRDAITKIKAVNGTEVDSL